MKRTGAKRARARRSVAPLARLRRAAPVEIAGESAMIRYARSSIPARHRASRSPRTRHHQHRLRRTRSTPRASATDWVEDPHILRRCRNARSSSPTTSPASAALRPAARAARHAVPGARVAGDRAGALRQDHHAMRSSRARGRAGLGARRRCRDRPQSRSRSSCPAIASWAPTAASPATRAASSASGSCSSSKACCRDRSFEVIVAGRPAVAERLATANTSFTEPS